jgi:hypothetical protein
VLQWRLTALTGNGEKYLTKAAKPSPKFKIDEDNEEQ